MIALQTPGAPDLEAARHRLADAGVGVVLGHFVNPAGIHLAKTVPLERLGALTGSGLGASPTWNVFCIDGGIAFTPRLGAVGDLRLRADLDALVALDGGLAWAPVELADQYGEPFAVSSRALLRNLEARLAADGITALVGHELEFVLTDAAGDALPRRNWTPYGAGGLLDVEAFVHELSGSMTAAGVPLEQLHAEYAAGQLELSLPPATPLASADRATLARFLVCRVARRHGLRASFSPVPFPGTGNSGAHVHLSISRDGAPVFGERGAAMSEAGGSAIAGILRSLPGLQALLAGSVLSSQRLLPGHWAGAWIGWGTENRETAVRFVESTPGAPYGANIEVKIGDPSANVYTATAAVLGVAAAGIAEGLARPAEVTVDPAGLDAAEREARGIATLPSDTSAALDALAVDPVLERVLGEQAVETAIAVRRYELDTLADRPVEQLAETLRLAWSV